MDVRAGPSLAATERKGGWNLLLIHAGCVLRRDKAGLELRVQVLRLLVNYVYDSQELRPINFRLCPSALQSRVVFLRKR